MPTAVPPSHRDNPLRDRQPFNLNGWTVDPLSASIEKDGEVIRVEPKVMHVLMVLVDNAGTTVTREELFEVVWEGAFVEENVLNRSVSQLRKAFGDDPRNPQYIETIPKVGYRLSSSASLRTGNVATATATSEGTRGWVWAIPLVAALVTVAGFALSRDSNPTLLQPLPRIPLTAMAGVEFAPAISPDGQHIAFIHRDSLGRTGLYMRSLELEEPVLLTSEPGSLESAPEWTTDGLSILFVRSNGSECDIFSISVISRSERRMFSCGGPLYGPISLTPDGGSLLLARSDRTSGRDRLELVDLTDNTRNLVYEAAEGAVIRVPSLSFDGTRVAFGMGNHPNDQDVHVMPLRGGEPLRITNDGTHIPGLAWSIDGRQIYFSSARSGDYRLWSVPERGGTPVWLAAVGAYDPGTPDVRPGIFVYEEWDFDYDIYRVGGADPVQVIGSSRWDQNPAISPDASRLAFASNRAGESELWVATIDGEDMTRLTRFDAHVSSPAWSPDGRFIVFEVSNGDGSQIYTVDSRGGEPLRISPDSGNNAFASWDPDGSRIIFSSDAAGGDPWQLWSVLPDGSEAAPMSDLSVGVMRFSPGGGIYGGIPDSSGLWLMAEDGSIERVFDAVGGWPIAWALSTTHLYYLRNEAGVPFVWRRPLDGGNEEQVARIGRSVPGGAQLSVSPDGSLVFVSRTQRAEADLLMVDGID